MFDLKAKVIHIIIGLNDGGAESVLYRLCVDTPKFEHIIVSLTSEGKYALPLRTSGFPVYCLNITLFNFFLKFAFLVRFLIKERPDIVQTWMYHAAFFGGLASKLSSISRPVVWNLRRSSVSTSDVSKLTYLLVRVLAVFSYIFPTKVVACSLSGIDFHVNLGYSKHNMCYIPNGVDICRFYPDSSLNYSFRRRYNISSSLPLIGHVGRFHPSKDHPNLFSSINICRKSPIPFHILLAGSGISTTNAKLMKLLHSFELLNHVTLLDSFDDIPLIMNAIDFLVSSSFTEGFPNVVSEAMACGTPCIVTDVGDSRTIVSDTGWLCPPSSPSSLAKAINSALAIHNSHYYLEKSSKCIDRIGSLFSLPTMVSSYSRLWSNLV